MQSEQSISPLDTISHSGHDGESRKTWIDMMIKNNNINSINYSEFDHKNSICLATGSSGVIRKTLWKTKERYVVLKQVLSYSIRMEPFEHEELVKEIKAFYSIKNYINDTDHKHVIEFCGISSRASKDLQEEFFLILEYADKGDLQDYLIQNCLEWEHKVIIARHITCGLRFLHKNKILHRDLHTGNVVIKSDNCKFGFRAIITDFGLSRVVSRHSISNQHVKGRTKFTDPIILNRLCETFGEIYSYSSDIYSLGVIMWEISRNDQGIQRMPEGNKCVEALRIIGGKREEPVAGSTQSYVEIYKECWDGNPEKRPDINRVYELIHKDDVISGKEWKDTTKLESTKNECNETVSDNTTIDHDLKIVMNVSEQSYGDNSESNKLKNGCNEIVSDNTTVEHGLENHPESNKSECNENVSDNATVDHDLENILEVIEQFYDNHPDKLINLIVKVFPAIIFILLCHLLNDLSRHMNPRIYNGLLNIANTKFPKKSTRIVVSAN
ncbi:kinase-like domain-containing protein [Gigaspora margarita]|uniref:Kinase-like domain-containing protein n=1 Tax=Gigaspora margarita TaxID=4874 RepID=A0A8H4EKM4_GIGMA|nr:kinase-like domain-containing protein [Gigaspora margarita]